MKNLRRKPLYKQESLILRDILAIDRTRLANERTLLSWQRTAIMLLVSGMTLIKLFSDSPMLEGIGMTLIPVSFVLSTWGIVRFIQMKQTIDIEEANDGN